MRPLCLLALTAVILSGCAGKTQSESRLPVYDLAGKQINPLAAGEEPRATVLLFTRTDCPIANRYAPEVRRLCEIFKPQQVVFWMVYPDPAETPESIRQHLAQYAYPCDAVQDPYHALVRLTKVTVTPEAAVFDSEGTLVYRGRIDDRYVDFGRARPTATSFELKDAIEATLERRAVAVTTMPAVGCYISDVEQ